jgi:23S rRNA (adenine-N6)-dimethyltransferase
VDAQRRAPRPSGRQPDGQHFLRSSRLATELVEQAGISARDLVVEIGAGSGRLTMPLAERSGRLIAVERDPAWADRLRSSFSNDAHVAIVRANALHVPLPRDPYRVFGNLPFTFGSRILARLLDDVGSPLQRMDALLQYEMARKRAQIHPSPLVSLGWQPWWEFRLVRHVPRTAFEPLPSVDAGMLSVTRRGPHLLPISARPRYVRLIAKGFSASAKPLRLTLRSSMAPRNWAGFVRERGIAPDVVPTELDVFDWVALFDLVSRSFDRR